MTGTSVMVINKITSCDDVVICAGAVVISDITDRGCYIGIPARKVS